MNSPAGPVIEADGKTIQIQTECRVPHEPRFSVHSVQSLTRLVLSHTELRKTVQASGVRERVALNDQAHAICAIGV